MRRRGQGRVSAIVHVFVFTIASPWSFASSSSLPPTRRRGLRFRPRPRRHIILRHPFGYRFRLRPRPRQYHVLGYRCDDALPTKRRQPTSQPTNHTNRPHIRPTNNTPHPPTHQPNGRQASPTNQPANQPTSQLTSKPAHQPSPAN